MRDLPFFTTQAGVASLTLKEIPYKGEAYVRLQDSLQPETLLKECCEFCRTAGALRVYATGHPVVDRYPFHTAILQMVRLKEGLPDSDASLVPVQQESLMQWRAIYNERMMAVANSATMTEADASRMLSRADGYFIFKEDILLGIGMAAGDKIDAIISVHPGSGREVLLTLCRVLNGKQITVEVASQNERAVHLYEKLGFVVTGEISRWHRIF